MSRDNFIFTSESVTEGHPDKMADQISDAILDAALETDAYSRVACESLLTTGLVVLAGEITTRSLIDYDVVVRDTIKDIGYTDSSMGFDADTCAVVTSIHKQSQDIAIGVDENKDKDKELGAGDQGLMFGYATSETDELMPLPIVYAHRLSRKLTEVRKNLTLPFLRPDGKSQVTVKYENRKPVSVDAIVVSSQHSPDISYKDLEESIREEVINKTIHPEMLTTNTKIFINPTGRFVTGGPMGDTGLTGRKIIIDTYGGWARHGGGAFSGKDPSKVDRSAAYMARYIAKNIIASGIAKECEIQLAYAIGISEPVSVMVDTLGTSEIPGDIISNSIREVFDLKPAGIIKTLDLLRPIYRDTAAYGHFGRINNGFTWENTDKTEDLLRAIK